MLVEFDTDKKKVVIRVSNHGYVAEECFTAKQALHLIGEIKDSVAEMKAYRICDNSTFCNKKEK